MPCHAYPLRRCRYIDRIRYVVISTVPCRPRLQCCCGTPHLAQEGSEIVMNVWEFMNNFEVIDVAHIRPGYNSHHYPVEFKYSQYSVFQLAIE